MLFNNRLFNKKEFKDKNGNVKVSFTIHQQDNNTFYQLVLPNKYASQLNSGDKVYFNADVFSKEITKNGKIYVNNYISKITDKIKVVEPSTQLIIER